MASLLTLHPRREASHRSRSAHRTSTHIPKQAATITVLSPDDVKDLRGRYHTKELVVIGLLDLLQLQLHLVMLLDQALATGIVGGLHTAFLAHLPEDGTLLLLHLAVDGEELGALVGCQSGLLGDKLLHLSLELLGRELLGLIGLTDQNACQEEHHAD